MEDLNELINVAREAAFFIRSIDGYENSKLASKLSSLAKKVESHKLLAIGRLAYRVVYRNSKKAVEQSVQRTCAACGSNEFVLNEYNGKQSMRCANCGASR